MNKKEFSYVVISSSGDKLEQIHGVYKDVEGACYGARSALYFLNMEMKQRLLDVRLSPQKKQ